MTGLVSAARVEAVQLVAALEAHAPHRHDAAVGGARVLSALRGQREGLCEDGNTMRGVKTRIRYAFHASRKVNTPHLSTQISETSLSKY